MQRAPRPTENVIAVLSAMLDRPRKPFYGLELAKHADIGSATIYAAMTRLERAGLVQSRWEEVDPAAAGRPRRRLYRLTGEGAEVGRKMLAEHKPRLRHLTEQAGWWPTPEAEPS